MQGPPEVYVRFKRSDGGERSRRRKGIARKMLRGESCGDWALVVVGFVFVGGMMFDDGDGDGVVVVARGDGDGSVRRRRAGVWEA